MNKTSRAIIFDIYTESPFQFKSYRLIYEMTALQLVHVLYQLWCPLLLVLLLDYLIGENVQKRKNNIFHWLTVSEKVFFLLISW